MDVIDLNLTGPGRQPPLRRKMECRLAEEWYEENKPSARGVGRVDGGRAHTVRA